MKHSGTTNITPRKLPQQARSQLLVRSVLEATSHILSKEGYAALNTNRVAELTGISIGSLYQYFPNKKSLIAGLIVSQRQELRDAVVTAAQQTTEADVTEWAKALVRAYADWYAKDLPLKRILWPHGGRAMRSRDSVAIQTDIREAIRDSLVQVFGAPESRAENSALMIHSLIDGTLDSYLQDHDPEAVRGELEAQLQKAIQDLTRGQ